MNGKAARPLSRGEIGVLVLAALTGAIHLLLGILFFPDFLAILFIGAAGGYAVGIVLVIRDTLRRVVYVGGIPFVGSQIIAWYALNRPQSVGDVGPIEAIDKIIQVILILGLIVMSIRES